MTPHELLDISNLLRLIFLLAPVFVSFFWAIELRINKKGGIPQRFLSIFMFATGVLFFCQFLYFAPITIFFPYAEIPLSLLGLLIFPLYHIYFRILMVDAKFSFKVHSPHFILPLVLVLIYSVAIIISDKLEFRNYLFSHPKGHITESIMFPVVMYRVVKIAFLLLLILTVIRIQLLFRKGKNSAIQYYSDINDAENNYAKTINKTMIATAFISFLFNLFAHSFLLYQSLLLNSGALLFAVAIYIIGKQGINAKLSNPGFGSDDAIQSPDNSKEFSLISGEKLTQMVLMEFEQNKIHLNPELNK